MHEEAVERVVRYEIRLSGLNDERLAKEVWRTCIAVREGGFRSLRRCMYERAGIRGVIWERNMRQWLKKKEVRKE